MHLNRAASVIFALVLLLASATSIAATPSLGNWGLESEHNLPADQRVKIW